MTKVFGVAAVLALAAAAALLLPGVRPRLGGNDGASFPYWARLDEDEIRACIHGDSRAARIRVLSRMALTKYRTLRHAVDLSLVALVLLLLAAIGALA
ncbi:Pycsar system effector family protein [Streptomyces sp. NPDC006476]|uniref:Pycsar system effector family protein n=1 Tax=Streptomyces sp. NPDC006476 TaxID=3157175 RepID=UPI0033A8D8DB